MGASNAQITAVYTSKAEYVSRAHQVVITFAKVQGNAPLTVLEARTERYNLLLEEEKITAPTFTIDFETLHAICTEPMKTDAQPIVLDLSAVRTIGEMTDEQLPVAIWALMNELIEQNDESEFVFDHVLSAQEALALNAAVDAWLLTLE